MQPGEPSVAELSWERVDAALRALLDLDPDEQARHLERMAHTDAALAARLARLLGGSGRAAGLDSDAFIAGVAEVALREVGRSRSGQQLGAWRLQQCIGAGGMAEVYLATRAIESGEQQAAVKLVNVPGATWGTESIVREAQVLARLSDPRIARLLDFGRSEAGEPWIAMEFVEGLPIDRWCASRELAVRDRIRLMLNVAMAVDHAHRNLVVHRDIKPGNVFVSASDGGVKLLDFGIARALPGAGRDATRTAMRAYTEAWASPEQLAGEAVAVASDIYQLGELLYLLLAGTHPFPDTSNPVTQMKAMQLGPEPPSRRARAGTASAQRLARQASADLDAIALKAMEFRPEHRYLSARDFADDLRRWLDGAAVSARRGRLYRAGRMLQRHWGLAAISTLLLVLLAGYIANLRDREALLETQRARTQRMLDVAVEILNEADPYLSAASSTLAEASLQRIRERVRSESAADPEFHSRILSLLASVQARRGQNRVGVELIRESLAIATEAQLDEAWIAQTALATARQLSNVSRNDEALQVLDAHAAALRRHFHLPSQSLRARIEQQHGDVAESRARLEALVAEIPQRRTITLEQRAVLNQLAIALGDQGEKDASIAAAERAFAGFEPRSASEIASWNSYALNLAVAYGDANRYSQADALHREVAEWTRSTLGDAHPRVAVVERSRAVGLIRVTRFRDAHDVLVGAAPALANMQQPWHRVAFLRVRGLTSLYSGRVEQALTDLVDADAIARTELGNLPGERPQVLQDLAWTLFELGALDEAAFVAARVARDTNPPARRGAMLRLLLPISTPDPEDSSAADADRALIASQRCAAVEFEALRLALNPASGTTPPELPPTCDGQTAAMAHALGAAWSPPWVDEFPRPPFESPLIERLRARDVAARPLPAGLQAVWRRWRDAQDDAP